MQDNRLAEIGSRLIDVSIGSSLCVASPMAAGYASAFATRADTQVILLFAGMAICVVGLQLLLMRAESRAVSRCLDDLRRP